MKLRNEQLIKKWEALRLEAYMPTPHDVWTIGWGHTKGVKPGMIITKEKAQQYFYEDTAWAVKAVNDLVKVPVSQNQFDSLVSLVFNIGTPNFRKSTLLRKLNNGDYQGAAEQFPRWNKQRQNGKLVVLRGLTRRRAEEMEYFLSSVSSKEWPSNNVEVEGPAPLKPIGLSKELVGGVAALLSGVGSLFGDTLPVNDNTLSTVFCVALVGVGLMLVYNRLKARRNGDR